MRMLVLMIGNLFFSFVVFGQEKERAHIILEQQIENQTEQDDSETENDEHWQQLEYFRKHPVDLNEADEDDLKLLQLLSDLQIVNFFRYRVLLGKLINIYELQSIPGWDLATIRKLLPFITVKEPLSVSETMRQRFRGGDNIFLLRYGRMLEKSSGYNRDGTGDNYYQGSASRLLMRYKYQYKNLLQAGITADKDAGESFFRNQQKAGFDFYSIHLFARRIGAIKAIAVGDYSVNMGQGLVQWQGLAFSKGAEVLNIKKQGPALRPYNSAGEFNFHRGAAVNWQRGKWEALLFVSYRKLSANRKEDSFQNNGSYISSLLSSGYHRTASELEDRNSLGMFGYGGMISHKWTNGRIGFNGSGYKFSLPFKKEAEPHNLFAFSGEQLRNYSIDYSYTFKNIHVFGEAAIDNKGQKASLSGLLGSIDSKLDIALLHRHISRAYQSFFSNAFTENSIPSNENGWYAAISLRPIQAWRIDGYMDIFRFPWLKARVDAPSNGREYFIQLTYIPSKQLEIYTKFRSELKSINRSGSIMPAALVDDNIKQNWRIQVNYIPDKTWELRNRIELLWNVRRGEQETAKGFLGYADIIYKQIRAFYGGNMRFLYFETDNYESRIYSFENDVAYSYSIPAYYNKGFRYYINYHINITKMYHLRTSNNINFYLKFAQTIAMKEDSIGSGLDKTLGNYKTDLKFQLLLGW